MGDVNSNLRAAPRVVAVCILASCPELTLTDRRTHFKDIPAKNKMSLCENEERQNLHLCCNVPDSEKVETRKVANLQYARSIIIFCKS